MGGKLVGELEREGGGSKGLGDGKGRADGVDVGKRTAEGVRWIVDGKVVARGAVGSWGCGGSKGNGEGHGKGRVRVRVVVGDYLGRETEGEVGLVVI